ncbi:MAG: hypothetical protein ACYDEX_05790 [Mobilitalea sp.]
MILSNKIEVEFERNAIDKDFDIFIVSKEKGNFFESNVMDIANQEFKALSVVYYFGNQWFVMFRKAEVDINKLKELVATEDPEAIINQVSVVDETSIYPNVLAQLLINMLSGPINKKLAYNNVSGRLYYIRPKFLKHFPKTFHVLYMRLTKEFYMSMEVTTFSRVMDVYGKIPDKKFIFDEKTNYFRKKLKGDVIPDSNCYVEKALSTKKKNKLDFLNFYSYEEFCDSKVGIYNEFVNDVKTDLADYIQIKNGGYESYNNYSFIEEGFENREYGLILSKRDFYIVDEIQSKESEQIVSRIQHELINHYSIQVSSENYKENSYVIRLIHNKDYYEKNGLQDQDLHQQIDTSVIVQHITFEDFKLEDKKASPALKKVLQELIIKGDICDHKFSIVNWEKDLKWNFVKADKNWDKESKKYYWIYYKMTIMPDGSFVLSDYDNRDFTEDDEWNEIDEALKKHNKWPTEVEGMVYCDYSNLNVILKTEQTTMPNFEKLAATLKMTNKENIVNIEIICIALEEYMTQSDNSKYVAAAEEMLEGLKLLGVLESKIGDVLPYLGIRSGFGKDFNRYLFQTTGMLLHPTPKDEEVRSEYFDAVLNIKYFEKDDKYYYFVGTADKKLNQSLHNACLLREVISLGDKLDMSELLKLMAVGFVRNGQYTVLPFPFKYLNEIIEANSNM